MGRMNLKEYFNVNEKNNENRAEQKCKFCHIKFNGRKNLKNHLKQIHEMGRKDLKEYFNVNEDNNDNIKGFVNYICYFFRTYLRLE